MAKKVDETRRSIIKSMLLAAGTALALSSKKARAQKAAPESQDEILYRETEAFRAYYESLRN
ncbi:hypothetical protein [Thermosulfurimonas dismutans]|uniref:Twin-arginine translocation signal domain-containing protein n=1 Tax=Thermosulfurimonas dismutans TaxID=999894 RepID=A0A179D2Z4_9BACT|nr:hypothetical protein [Thermosulfurimonas dismutans]OAQ20089.1 hypothetical protein TDIS_1814 [Thermosulfurimonas dismutans]